MHKDQVLIYIGMRAMHVCTTEQCYASLCNAFEVLWNGFLRGAARGLCKGLERVRPGA